jgi:hypothetical protein
VKKNIGLLMLMAFCVTLGIHSGDAKANEYGTITANNTMVAFGSAKNTSDNDSMALGIDTAYNPRKAKE